MIRGKIRHDDEFTVYWQSRGEGDTLAVSVPWRLRSIEPDQDRGIVSDGQAELPFSMDAVVGLIPSVGAPVRLVLAGDTVLEVEAIEEPLITGTRKLWERQPRSQAEETALCEAIDRRPELSLPWRFVGNRAVGGLVSIGFSALQELLLVSSRSGLGVFDDDGRVVERDRTVEVRQHTRGLAGIGPLAGEVVVMSDIPGGQGRQSTDDGWIIHRVGEAHLWVTPPRFRQGPDVGGAQIKRLDWVRAAAFSEQGKLLAVADGSHTLMLFARS